MRLIAERVRLRLKRTAEDIIAIGQELQAAKARLGHGRFLPWLHAEFQMSEMTAVRFIQVSERFGDESNKLLDFNPSILYLLAAPSTPDAVVEQVTAGEMPATAEAIRAQVGEAPLRGTQRAASADGWMTG